MPDAPVHETLQEARFELDEMFFSRTDTRGVLKSWNSVFQRVSGYKAEDLQNAPHKVVRHPDMPKAVFWVLWERIKAGRMTGAYVKNKALDGSFYWVYAMVTPINGGYLSVRIKPISPNLPVVADLYRDLLRSEKAEGFDAERSVGLLMSRLAEMGCRDYTEFMTRSLVQEMSARNEELRRDTWLSPGPMVEVMDAAANALQAAALVIPIFRRIRGFPVNLRIQARKQGGAGPIFAVIARDYERFCRNIEAQMQAFLDTMVGIADRVCDCNFLLCTSCFQQEMSEQFKTASGESAADFNSEDISLLDKQAKLYIEEARESLVELGDELRQFENIVRELNWMVGGLDATRTIGRVETARLDKGGATLLKMMEEADSFQSELCEYLDDIAKMAARVSSGVGNNRHLLEKAHAGDFKLAG